MPRHPRLSGKEFVGILQRHGFQVRRIRGSHHFLQHRDGRCTVVPVHGSEILGPGLTARILKDCELTVEQLHP